MKRIGANERQPAIGEHAYSGSCAPGPGFMGRSETFSVGVFEWVPSRCGMVLKRGKVKVRIKGASSHPDRVYAKAESVVAALDAGTYTGHKYFSVPWSAPDVCR